MIEVRGVRGGCEERGFIWNDECTEDVSNELGKKSCCSWILAEGPTPPFGNVMEDISVEDCVGMCPGSEDSQTDVGERNGGDGERL